MWQTLHGFPSKTTNCPPAGFSPSSPRLRLELIVSCSNAGKFSFSASSHSIFPRKTAIFFWRSDGPSFDLHKNVSYRPGEDVLRGVSGDAATIERIHSILRNYAAQVIDFATKFLSPYAGKWILDFSSFRPLEEEGRDLPLHKRNDLLHVDAFPTRPTRGGRILRIFTNLNPSRARIWNTTDKFDSLARQYADDAGLRKIRKRIRVQPHGAELGPKAWISRHGPDALRHVHASLSRLSEGKCGVSGKLPEDSPRISAALHAGWFSPTASRTAVLSGQYAIEQTFLIPPETLVAPQYAPYRILESLAGTSLVS